MIKMIVSDVDGTLLSHGYINPKCIESIKKHKKKELNLLWLQEEIIMVLQVF